MYPNCIFYVRFCTTRVPYVYFYNIPAYAGICKIPCPGTSEHGRDMGHRDTGYPRVPGADGIWDIGTRDPVGTITQPRGAIFYHSTSNELFLWVR